MKWHSCNICNGSGTRFNGYDNNNDGIYEPCDDCGGQGGYYVEDGNTEYDSGI